MRSASASAPKTPQRGRRGARLRTWPSPTPGAGAPSLAGRGLYRAAGADRGRHRRHGRGQDQPGEPHPPLLRRDRRARVLVDGAGRARLPAARPLRQQVGVVPQKAVLFQGTIRENLRWGSAGGHRRGALAGAGHRPGARVRRGQARAGWTSPVAQGGRNLSGGQRQRLTIARALVEQPGNPDPGRQRLGPGLRHRRCAAPGTCAASWTAGPRCSSSPSAPPPSATPTRSWSWTTAGPVGHRHARGAAGDLPGLPGDLLFPVRKGGEVTWRTRSGARRWTP